MMATITGLRGKYDKLNNQERLRLAADAIARDDGVDLSALRTTAPKVNHTIREPWLEDRYAALWRISVMFWLTIEMIDSERNSFNHKYMLARLLNGELLKTEFMDKARKKIDADLFLQIVEQQIKDNSLQLQSAAEAINQLAKNVGLKPEELISHAPADIRVRLKAMIADTTKDELPNEYVDEHYRIFSHYWPCLSEVKNEYA